MDVVVNNANYDSTDGQVLSSIGTIISLEKGPDSDEFFLTFEEIGGASSTFTDISGTIAADPPNPGNPVSSDIGMHTFQEIHHTIAAITGVPTTNGAVQSVYDDYIQQLPAVEAIDAFLPSHQMAVAQMALTSCSELVEDNGSIDRATFFPGFDFTAGAVTAFDSADRDTRRAQIINPILTAAMNVDQLDPTNNLSSQPVEASIADMLGSSAQQHLDDPAPASGDEYNSLIEELLLTSADTPLRTRQIVKAVCAAVTGGAVMIVQ